VTALAIVPAAACLPARPLTFCQPGPPGHGPRGRGPVSPPARGLDGHDQLARRAARARSSWPVSAESSFFPVSSSRAAFRDAGPAAAGSLRPRPAGTARGRPGPDQQLLPGGVGQHLQDPDLLALQPRHGPLAEAGRQHQAARESARHGRP
jgi:hypothetical protein